MDGTTVPGTPASTPQAQAGQATRERGNEWKASSFPQGRKGEHMSTQIATDSFKKQLFLLFEETFDHVHGVYLDRGTSLFETLEAISAEEASRPV